MARVAGPAQVHPRGRFGGLTVGVIIGGMPSTPIPEARPGATLEFFEEAARSAKAANQAVALMPGDLLALCKLARAAARLDDDVRKLASYGLQSAVPEVSEPARRVLAGRSSLPPAARAWTPPVEAPLNLKPLDVVEDRTLAQRQADGDATPIDCLECGGQAVHHDTCSRARAQS